MRRIIPVESVAERVDVEVDGTVIAAIPGESLAGMMIAHGFKTFRRTAKGQPRAPYCAMGTCFDCRVEVRRDQEAPITLRACMTQVEAGMVVTTGAAAGPRAEEV